MTRKAMILLVVLSTFVFFASGIGIGQAKGGPGSDCPPPNGAPVCIDGVFIPPGLAIACSNPKVAQHNKNCPEPPEEEEEVCGTAEGETPADGPVSGIVEQIAAGLRPDGAALADVLDAVACDLLAPLGL